MKTVNALSMHVNELSVIKGDKNVGLKMSCAANALGERTTVAISNTRREIQSLGRDGVGLRSRKVPKK